MGFTSHVVLKCGTHDRIRLYAERRIIDDKGYTGLDRDGIAQRLVELQARSLGFLTDELSKYHARTNKHSYFSKLPYEQKLAWTRYGLDHISSLYRIDSHHEDTNWEKNLAISSLGGGFRGVSESICGMIVVSHLLVPIVRSEFACDPVAQSVALDMLANAYENLIEKSLAVYSNYVRNAREAMLDSSARNLESISVEGLLTEIEVPKSIEAYRLTKCELEVLHLVGLGYENGEICAKLNTKLDTVKGQVRSLLAKTCLHNRTQLALLAVITRVCKKDEIAETLQEADR